MLAYYTKHGYRVIALAGKSMPGLTWIKAQRLKRFVLLVLLLLDRLADASFRIPGRSSSRISASSASSSSRTSSSLGPPPPSLLFAPPISRLAWSPETMFAPPSVSDASAV